MSKNKTLYAFPRADGSAGMSLRDYFAAKAMEALIVHYGVMTTENNHAKESYYIADKMLEEREK